MALKASLLLDFKRAIYELLVAAPELADVQILKRYPDGDQEHAVKDDSLSFEGMRSTQEPASLGPTQQRKELPGVAVLVRVQRGGKASAGADDPGDVAETRTFEILDQLATALHNAPRDLVATNFGIQEIAQDTDLTQFGAISYARAHIIAGETRLR